MQYKSFKDEALQDINAKMNKAVELIVLNSERTVKKTFTDFPNPPIDTGTLRRSITGKVLESKPDIVTAEVRASDERIQQGAVYSRKRKKKVVIKDILYAEFIEYGTVKMPARPFMRQGMIKAQKSNEDIIRKVFK